MNSAKQSGNCIDRQYARFKWFKFRFAGKASRQSFFEEGALLGFLSSVIIGLMFIPIVNLLFIPIYLLILIHIIGLYVRRLRDTGRNWTYIFLGLIPLVGVIILQYLAMDDSAPETEGETQQPMQNASSPAPAPAPDTM